MELLVSLLPNVLFWFPWKRQRPNISYPLIRKLSAKIKILKFILFSTATNSLIPGKMELYMSFFSLTFPKVCIFCFDHDQILCNSDFLLYLWNTSQICTNNIQMESPAACILQDYKIAPSLTNFIADPKKDLVRLKSFF